MRKKFWSSFLFVFGLMFALGGLCATAEEETAYNYIIELERTTSDAIYTPDYQMLLTKLSINPLDKKENPTAPEKLILMYETTTPVFQVQFFTCNNTLENFDISVNENDKILKMNQDIEETNISVMPNILYEDTMNFLDSMSLEQAQAYCNLYGLSTKNSQFCLLTCELQKNKITTIKIASKTAEGTSTIPSSCKKVMVVRTANDFIYNSMDWKILVSQKNNSASNTIVSIIKSSGGHIVTPELFSLKFFILSLFQISHS